MENTLILSISYRTGCYRHIKISSSAMLEELHKFILKVFDFEDDHLHAFFMNNRAWDMDEAYYSSYAENVEKYTSDYKLSDFKLEKGSKFIYIFDFGEEHKFTVKVLRKEEEPIKEPELIKSVGESPEQYPGEEEYDEKEELILSYADAAVNLYGVIAVKDFLEIYNSQNIQAITEKDILNLDDGGEYNYWRIYEEYIVNVLIEKKDLKDIPQYLRTINNKQRYIPAASEFIKYQEFMYTDEPVYQAKLRLFLEKLFGKNDTIMDLYIDIYTLCRLEAEYEDILEVFDEYNLEFSSAVDLEKFFKILTELMNHTRIWSNKGYTPVQYMELYSSQPIKSNKIGRNDPCPCGSGKKYKKCCGR